MNQEELLRRLRATFLEELEEQVEELDQLLLGLERATTDEERARQVNGLFRIAHNLKGAARAVDLRVVERVCHQLEDVFGKLRSGAWRLVPVHVEAFFQVADGFRAVRDRLARQDADSETPLAAVLERLGGLTADGAAGTPTATAATLEVSSQPEEPEELEEPEEPEEPDEAEEPEEPDEAEEPEEPDEAEEPEEPDEAPISLLAVSPEPAPVRGRGAEPAAGHVRISTGKLDALADASGELLIGHQRWENAVDQTRGIIEATRALGTQWRVLMRELGHGAGSEGHPSVGTDRSSEALQEAVRRHHDGLAQLERDAESLMRSTTDQLSINQDIVETLNAEVRRARMVPFAEACAGLDRMARDVARSRDKSVDVVVIGGDVEIDRSVVDLLKSPLLHLIRNCIEHGIEPPAIRRARGKDDEGRIIVAARLNGPQVEVTVEDDGAGVDLAAVRRKAAAAGLPAPRDDAEAVDLLFMPGFSTAVTVTEVAGRGVGLDVVKENIEARRGEIAVDFVPDEGTRFTIRLPLTLTVVRSLLLSVGTQIYAIDVSLAHRILAVDDQDIRSIEGRQWVMVDGRTMPVVALETLLDGNQVPPSRAGRRTGLWVNAGGRDAVILVDELLSEQDVLVKPLGERIQGIAGLCGCSVLVSGRIALILNVAYLLGRLHGGRRHVAFEAGGETARSVRRVLVVDDSVTTRTVEARIIAEAGYEVLTAVDGAEAWQIIQDSEPDIVVSDVEMPRMDGFELARAIRTSTRFKDLPVILVTSLARDEDKARGLEAGASAYIVKGTFEDTTLLQAIGQLI